MERPPFPASLALNRPVMAALRLLALPAWPLRRVTKAWLAWISTNGEPEASSSHRQTPRQPVGRQAPVVGSCPRGTDARRTSFPIGERKT